MKDEQVPAVTAGVVIGLNVVTVVLLLADWTVYAGPFIVVSTFFTAMGYLHSTGRISIKR